MKRIIRIANPEPNGKRYTSLRRAQYYLKMGRAILVENELFFLTRRQAARQAARQDNESFKWRSRPSAGYSVMQAAREVAR